MSITITLMQNLSEDNRIGKNLNTLTGGLATVKDETSIISPTILWKGVDANVVNCNYMYIADFKRYYFVRNITSYRNGLWELKCHVDVLESFKDEILACTGIIARQENKHNLYINDGVFMVYQDMLIRQKYFPNGFNNWAYILTVAGS